jgi:hypothetical protein
LVNARLDPEIHHDGYIYTAAVAASEGLIPNKDFFAQYGPITPFIQGIWLHATGPTLLNLRILNAIFLVAVSWITFRILNRRCSETNAYLLVASYNISTPMILPYLLPWPSVLSTMVILISMKLLTDRPDELRNIDGFLIASILSFGVFIRIHVLVVVTLLFVAFLLTKQSKAFLVSYLVGFISTISAALCLLLFSGALPSFIDQVILYPAGAYPGLSAGWKVALANLFVFSLFIFYPTLYFIFTRIAQRRNLEYFFIAILFSTLVFCIVLSSRIKNIPVEHRSYRNPYYLVHFLGQNLLLYVPLASIGFFVIWLLNILYSLLKRQKILLDRTKLFTLALCLGSISQLYPGPDQLHAWWIAPIFIAALPIFNFTFNKSVFLSGVLLLILFNGYRNYLEWSKPRFYYSAPAFVGMLGTDPKIDKVMNAVANFVPNGGGYFHCPEGAFAAASGKYLSRVPDYVNWGPQTPNKLYLSGTHFSCDKALFQRESKDQILWRYEDNSMVIWRIDP